MMMIDDGDDEWVKAAMNDDSMVAELLLRIKMSNASGSERSVPAIKVLSGWGVRRPRSAMRNNDVVLVKKGGDAMRCSPVTPFSWSEEGTTGGGGSPSTTADGCETSSLFNNNYSPTTRSKTFAELKEEENILLRESLYLNKELTTLRATFNDQKSRNESFKRLKVEHNLQDTGRTWPVSYEHKASHSNYIHQTLLALPEHAPSDKAPQLDYYEHKASHSYYSHQKKPLVLPKRAPSEKAPQPDCFEQKHSSSNYTYQSPLVLPKHAPSDKALQTDSCEHRASHSNHIDQKPVVLQKHAPSDKATQPDFYEHKGSHSNYTHQTPLVLPKHAPSDTAPQPASPKVQNSNTAQERNFILPDLNMAPFPEDDSSDT